MTLPKHIEKTLVKEREKLIYGLSKKDFQLREIAFIFKISVQRVYQIINESNAKKN